MIYQYILVPYPHKLYQENQELEEKITCLESDSHNEVSQAEYDELEAEKKYLNCDLDLTITDDNPLSVSFVIVLLIWDCIFLDTVSKLTSPILFVPVIKNKIYQSILKTLYLYFIVNQIDI